jgi:hypothetical protein
MVSCAHLRRMLLEWPKHPGCKPVERAPLTTAAFPGTFNLSSTEHHWLREYGGYLDWDRDLVFSTIQTCVRVNDLALLAAGEGWCHLGVFEMADLAGEVALARPPDYAALHTRQLREAVRLFGVLGIPSERVHASYCIGGPVRALTGGDYRFDDEIPPDTLSRDALLAAGVPERNLIADATRATLLSLHVHRPTPWGYRNEIYVETDGPQGPRLVDVATEEYLVWRPLFAGTGRRRDEIVGLAPLEGGAVGVGVGVERLCMVANGLPRVHAVDYLEPFYAELARALGRNLVETDYVAGESLRALHRIHTDLYHHREARFDQGVDGRRHLSTKRRKKAALLKRGVPVTFGTAALERLLQCHAETQPWHAHLADGIAPTVRALMEYRDAAPRRLLAAGERVAPLPEA